MEVPYADEQIAALSNGIPSCSQRPVTCLRVGSSLFWVCSGFVLGNARITRTCRLTGRGLLQQPQYIMRPHIDMRQHINIVIDTNTDVKQQISMTLSHKNRKDLELKAYTDMCETGVARFKDQASKRPHRTHTGSQNMTDLDSQVLAYKPINKAPLKAIRKRICASCSLLMQSSWHSRQQLQMLSRTNFPGPLGMW